MKLFYKLMGFRWDERSLSSRSHIRRWFFKCNINSVLLLLGLSISYHNDVNWLCCWQFIVGDQSRLIKQLGWLLAVVQSLLIIASRKHYTVDVVVAWYGVCVIITLGFWFPDTIWQIIYIEFNVILVGIRSIWLCSLLTRNFLVSVDFVTLVKLLSISISLYLLRITCLSPWGLWCCRNSWSVQCWCNSVVTCEQQREG